MSKPKLPNKADFKFYIELDTRWADMDCIGHINNATFLTYVESARIKLIQKLGFLNVPIIMASIKIDYLNQLSFPSTMEIGQKISRIGNSSFDILTGIFKLDDDKLITLSTTTLVCFDYKTQKSIPVPDEIRNNKLD
jgi:acyl-CoA thioester hydrolase